MLTVVCMSAILSVVLHEGAHVIAAKRFGARVAGVKVKFPRIVVLVDESGIPKWSSVPIALAGPASECLVIAAALVLHITGLLSGPVALYAALWPTISLVVNLVPFKVSDGGKVLQYFTQRRIEAAHA